ncbi:putative pentatricopeptide repeat-containing protein [Hibiscus syriacus]|uniref:Pentatricopeptide repeat-containing protein n=1 Tax=Hibiscus syriacus TaxID=106335 RepID=A0A6A3BQM3_HIBSY|nr:putative pentatricopeptide repeat-containing protein [Hibiscus syriacus]
MQEKDSISWTTMITGLTQNGLYREAIDLFREMRIEGLAVDQFTFGSMLTGCGGLMALKEGKQVHAFIIRTNHQDNVFVGSALVDMYCKCKIISSALCRGSFQEDDPKECCVLDCTACGLWGQNGFSEEAIRIFCDMQRNGIIPDYYTLGSVISSCANLASLEEGAQFHGQAIVSGLFSFTTVSNALITLYGKCGSIEDADRLFNEMTFRDEVSWTALVSGYAQFACSRAGLVEKGYQYFESVVSRSKMLYINKMPRPPDAIGWSALLSSCRLHGNLEIGKWAAASLQELEPHIPAGYI